MPPREHEPKLGATTPPPNVSRKRLPKTIGMGSAASHGCIRIDNGPIMWMAHHLPQGTPVEIEH